ncbi:hypothetical protein Q7P37_007921 [Cladosporium fusiforme]
MAHQGRCIFLAGAPEADELEWDEGRLISTFTIGSRTLYEESTPQPTSTWNVPKWREITLEPNRAKAAYQAPEADFFSFSDMFPDLDIATKQDFLDHSIALIDDLASSQLAPTNVDETTFLNSTTLSFISDTSLRPSDDSEISQSPSQKPSLPPNLPITDIKQIPSASHILSIAPQTITINLLCAVISVSQPRTVTLRRRRGNSHNGNPQANTMEILDLLLGDETRAGFSISFWLPPRGSQKANHHPHNDLEDLRSSLQSLRGGDVVLVTNVALSVWRGAVYGQSLGRRWARNSTRVAKVGDMDVERGLPFGVKGKLARVRGWSEEFVGKTVARSGSGKGKGKGKRKIREEELPPDSQV